MIADIFLTNFIYSIPTLSCIGLTTPVFSRRTIHQNQKPFLKLLVQLLFCNGFRPLLFHLFGQQQLALPEGTIHSSIFLAISWTSSPPGLWKLPNLILRLFIFRHLVQDKSDTCTRTSGFDKIRPKWEKIVINNPSWLSDLITNVKGIASPHVEHARNFIKPVSPV